MPLNVTTASPTRTLSPGRQLQMARWHTPRSTLRSAEGVADYWGVRSFAAADGTPLFAPVGQLVVDHDEAKVLCHLCGRWYGLLAPRHLPKVHAMTAAQYRDLVGLNPRHPLQAPVHSERQGALMKARIVSDERVKVGMEIGFALSRSGELQARAREHHAERPFSAERVEQLQRHGSA